MSDETESRERNTNSINRNRDALDRLTGAFGAAVSATLQGAPKSFSDATGELLSQFGSAGRGIAQVMQGAEVYVGVWRDLTSRGINFGNEIDTMAITAGQANLKLGDLAKLAAENSEIFAQLGASANTGITRFLAEQGRFLQATSGENLELRKSLEQLGMSTDAINERFLQYDAVANITNIRERRYGQARNRAAAEFAEEMDRLSKLTGEQSDRLAQERAEISRQGNIFAFTQMIDESVRDEVTGSVQRLGKMGGTIGDLATDIITRGFPNPDDPAVMALHSFAPELVQTLHGIRQAAMNGDEAAAQRLQELAVSQAAALRNNQDVLNMAVLGGANEYTKGLQDVITDLNKSAEALSQNELREQFREQFGREASNIEELTRFRNDLIAAERDAQRDGTSTGGEQALNTYIDGLRTLQQTAATLQRATLQTIFDGIGRAASALSTLADGIDVPGATQRAIDSARGSLDRVIPTIGMSDEEARQYQLRIRAEDRAADLVAAAETLASEGNEEESQNLRDQAAELRTAADSLGSGTTESELLQLLNSATQTMTTSGTIIVNGREIVMDPGLIESLLDGNTPPSDSGHAIGTLGTTGKLFKDFGRETLTALHGIEAVTTPEQMASIVENSALGALRAAQQAYTENTSRNTSSSLTGMLNTVRASMSEMSTPNQGSNADIAELRAAILSLAPNMRGPMEEALNNTIGQSLTQLVDLSKENVDMGDKIRKGFNTLSGDYMRGA